MSGERDKALRARLGAFDVHEAAANAAGPAVVVFGYVGSTSRHLAKYAAAFLSAGAGSVYTTTARTYDVFFRHANLRALGAQGLDLLAARHANAPAVLVYMSNGGAFVHVQVLKLLAEDAARSAGARRFGGVRVAGTVFDSAPAYLSMNSMARAPTEGIKSAPLRALAYWLARALLPPLMLAAYGSRIAEKFFEELEADPLPCRALYIYSAHDRITDAAKLDEHVARRRARHVLGDEGVRALRIGKGEPASPHVLHLIKHPERYREELARLLKDVAKAGAGGS